MNYVIQNGYVIDPANHISGKYDVFVKDGKVSGIEASGGSVPANYEAVDAADHIVTPGLIDLHVHSFEAVEDFGVFPDKIGVQTGVTTVVDAGSSGSDNFERFRQEMIEPSKTQVLAWLNIAGPGLVEGRSELANLARLEPEKTLELIRKYPQYIIGIKARMSSSVVKLSGLEPMKIAKRVAREAGLPVMVHIGNAPPKLGEVLDLLDEGDVVTHAFHGKRGGILDENGNLIPEAERALSRGVHFDVGHGTASFSFKTMRRAKEIGINPFSISTDVYMHNLKGPVHSLTMTMTKFLALGYSLDEIVRWTTQAPSLILRKENDLGTLKIGSVADITILKQVNKRVVLTDSEGESMEFGSELVAATTIRGGDMIPCKTSIV